MLLTRLNSNLRPGDRIEPKSCCFGSPHEEGVPLFPESWCRAPSKAACCESTTRPHFQTEIRPRSHLAASPGAFWPPTRGAADASPQLESSAEARGKRGCGTVEICVCPPLEKHPGRHLSSLRSPGDHADSNSKRGVPEAGGAEEFQAGPFAIGGVQIGDVGTRRIALGPTSDGISVGPGKHSPRVAQDTVHPSGGRSGGSGVCDWRIGPRRSRIGRNRIGRLADRMRPSHLAARLGGAQPVVALDSFSYGMAAQVVDRPRFHTGCRRLA